MEVAFDILGIRSWGWIVVEIGRRMYMIGKSSKKMVRKVCIVASSYMNEFERSDRVLRYWW